jgi:hypothetical protein
VGDLTGSALKSARIRIYAKVLDGLEEQAMDRIEAMLND